MSCACGGPWPGIGHLDGCEPVEEPGKGSWFGAESKLEGDGVEPIPDRPWTPILWVWKPAERELDETPADPLGLGNEPDRDGLPGWAQGFGQAAESVLGGMARVERAAAWVEHHTRDRRSPERRHREETAGLSKRSGGAGKRPPGFHRFGTWSP